MYQLTDKQRVVYEHGPCRAMTNKDYSEWSIVALNKGNMTVGIGITEDRAWRNAAKDLHDTH